MFVDSDPRILNGNIESGGRFSHRDRDLTIFGRILTGVIDKILEYHAKTCVIENCADLFGRQSKDNVLVSVFENISLFIDNVIDQSIHISFYWLQRNSTGIYLRDAE